MNTYSLFINYHYQKKINDKPLETLIKRFYLLINNKLDRLTRLVSRRVSIIDLALSTVKLGSLSLLEIPEDYLSVFDYGFIIVWWENKDYDLSTFKNRIPTKWDINGLLNMPDNLENTHKD